MNFTKSSTATSLRSSGRKYRSKAVAVAFGLVALTALTGCENVSKRHFTVGSVPTDYRTKHPIVISEKEQTMDIPVAVSSKGMPLPEVSAVTGFASLFKKSASGSINILIPSGSANERAAKRVAREVIGVLRSSGISRSRIILAPYEASNYSSSAPVRLSYSAIQAGVEGCGQWPADLAADSENRNYHNFGCASQSNLAAQIANPSDLLGPRGSTSIDAERRLRVIDAYRNAKETSTVYAAP